MFKTNMFVQLSNLFVQSGNLTEKLNTEIEVSAWGFVGIIAIGVVLGLGLWALTDWLINR